MADYSTMIEQFGDWWGQDSTGMEDFMGKIAHHESAGTMDPSIHQYGGGPGRGLFQYETGANQGGMTARNRLAGWYEEQDAGVPDWLNQKDMENSGLRIRQIGGLNIIGKVEKKVLIYITKEFLLLMKTL